MKIQFQYHNETDLEKAIRRGVIGVAKRRNRNILGVMALSEILIREIKQHLNLEDGHLVTITFDEEGTAFTNVHVDVLKKEQEWSCKSIRLTDEALSKFVRVEK